MNQWFKALIVGGLGISINVNGAWGGVLEPEPEPKEEENFYLDAIESLEKIEQLTRKIMFSKATEGIYEDADRELLSLQGDLTTESRANITRQGGETLLMVAASRHSDPRFVQAILDAGADIHAVDDQGRTALMYNAMLGETNEQDVTHVLIEAGAVVDARDHLGRTALMHSVRNSHKFWITRELVNHGADVNLRDQSKLGQTPLMHAAKNCTNVLSFLPLLKNGADIDVLQLTTNMTALHLATLYSTPEIAELFIKHGARIDSRMDGDATPLLLGLSQSVNPQVIVKLIELGADVSAHGVGDASVLRVAVGSDQPVEVFDALIKAGADIHERGEDDPMTLFEYLCMNGTHGEAIGRFVEAGADPNLVGMFGVPPLSSMIYNKQSASMVSAIIKAGAEVDAVSHAMEPSLGDGWTALHIAAMYSDDADVVRALIKAGADINKVLPLGDMGFTPLFLSIGDKVYNPEVMIALIEAGADVNARDAKGNTLMVYIEQTPRLKENAEVISAITDAMD